MSMTNPDSLATKADLHEMYGRIYPFLEGGGSGGSGGHTIEDSTGTALTQRDIMQFSDSFAPTDDSTDEVTKIGLNKLTSGEMDDIVTPLPSVQSRYHEYSKDEQIVGKWIDGSYIYEKTIDFGSLPNNTYRDVSVSNLNIDRIIHLEAMAFTNDKSEFIPIPNANMNVSTDGSMSLSSANK